MIATAEYEAGRRDGKKIRANTGPNLRAAALGNTHALRERQAAGGDEYAAGWLAGLLPAGAVEIETGEIPDDVLMRNADGTYEPRHERMARLRA